MKQMFKIYWQEMKKKLKVFSKNLIKMEMDKSPLKNLTMLIQTNKITPDPSAQAKNGILLEQIKICPLKKWFWPDFDLSIFTDTLRGHFNDILNVKMYWFNRKKIVLPTFNFTKDIIFVWIEWQGTKYFKSSVYFNCCM